MSAATIRPYSVSHETTSIVTITRQKGTAT